MADAAAQLLLAMLEGDAGRFQGVAALAVHLVQAGQAEGDGEGFEVVGWHGGEWEVRKQTPNNSALKHTLKHNTNSAGSGKTAAPAA